MVNYQNGKIYKIVSPSHPEVPPYYGSTTQLLCIRMANHRQDYKYTNDNITSKLILCYDDAIIMLVENYPCNSREELYRKEGEYILQNECVNKRVAGRKTEERKEDYLLYQQQYRENNKDYFKQKYQENREHRIAVAKKNNELRKEEIKEYQKQYREKNKEKFANYMKSYRKKAE